MSFLDELKRAGQRVLDSASEEIDDIFRGGDGSASGFPTFPDASPATGGAMEPDTMPAQSFNVTTAVVIGLVLWAVLR